MKFTLMPIVNQIYTNINIILRYKLLGTEIYNLIKKTKNKIKIPVSKENFKKEYTLRFLMFIKFL